LGVATQKLRVTISAKKNQWAGAPQEIFDQKKFLGDRRQAKSFGQRSVNINQLTSVIDRI